MKKLTILLASLLLLLSLVPAPKSVFADSAPRTTTTWTVNSTNGINVIPYVRVDKKALFVDFDHFTPNMDYIYYNLNYTNKNTNVLGGVEGSFLTTPPAYFASFGGLPYVRRQVLFGTCSGSTCVYASPQTVTLTVNTHYASGQIAQVTKVLTFPDNQF